LFAQRKETYKGQYGPELLVAVDEFTNDENPSWFDRQVAHELSEMGDDCAGHAEMWVDLGPVNGTIRDRCLGLGADLAGKLEET
jgi:hypothetical protein